jgi:hypothetical protein
VILQDLEGMTFGHATQFSPAMGKKAMTIWQVGADQTHNRIILVAQNKKIKLLKFFCTHKYNNNIYLQTYLQTHKQ